mgnify:CR=1 FL=1
MLMNADLLAFDKLCLLNSDKAEGKLELLSSFNMQVVAGLNVPNLQGEKIVDGVRYTTDEMQCLGAELCYYGLVRDINYKEGLRIISPSNLDRANVLMVVNPKVFCIPSNYVIRDDLKAELLARKPDHAYHFLADLLP